MENPRSFSMVNHADTLRGIPFVSQHLRPLVLVGA